MADLLALLEDLHAEGAELDDIVAGLDAEGWSIPTPSPGWTIANQIAHLAWTDDISTRAATDPTGFAALLKIAARNPTSYVDDGAQSGAEKPPAELLAGWRAGRARLASALRAVPAGTKVPWFGPPMSPASMVTARLMETWAHGQDVADALGVIRTPAARLRHVAHIAVRTRDFAFIINERTPPSAEFRVELRAPDGQPWTWGPEAAEQRVTGSALDFCLLATQRRHRDDLDVLAVGRDAHEWLDIAQAFAGLPGKGRVAGQFIDTANTVSTVTIAEESEQRP